MVQAVLLLIASIGIMLIGVKTLSEALQKLLNEKIKNFVNKFTKNRVRTSFSGMLLTFAMQSSTASTIMCVGLASVGILSLFQSIAFIIGCNFGSSLTLLLLGFNNLFIKEVFAMLCFVGFLLTFFKKDKLKLIGKALMGFGLIFSGLSFISSCIQNINSGYNLQAVFSSINNPILMFLLGIALTIILQSSFGSVALVVSVIVTNSAVSALNIFNLSFFVYGVNVGTTLTTLLVSLTSNNDGKKVALYHLIFNLVGVIIFIPITFAGFTKLLPFITKDLTFQVIFVDMIFNFTTGFVMLILLKPFYKLLNKIVKQKVAKGQEEWYINSATLQNPVLAVNVLNQQNLKLIKKTHLTYLLVEQNFYEKGSIKKIKNQIDLLDKACDLINVNVYKISGDLTIQEKNNINFVMFSLKTVKKILNILKKSLDVNNVNGVRIELYQYQKDVIQKLCYNQKQIFENLIDMMENLNIENNDFNYQEQTIKIFNFVSSNSELKNKQKLNYVSNLAISSNTEKKHYIFFNQLNLLQDMTNYLSDISVELLDMVNNLQTKGEDYDKELNTITSK